MKDSFHVFRRYSLYSLQTFFLHFKITFLLHIDALRIVSEHQNIRFVLWFLWKSILIQQSMNSSRSLKNHLSTLNLPIQMLTTEGT